MLEESPELGALLPDARPAIFPSAEPLTGRHVRLEPMNESDYLPLWHSVGAHDDLWTHWPGGPYTQDSWISALKEIHSEAKVVSYTIFQRGEPKGCLFLQPADLRSRVTEIGMMYGPSLQRTREATEAFFLLVSLAFDKLNYRRVEWKTDRLNKPSRRAAERYGLSYEGCLRQHGIYKGRNRDTVWYSMIDGEWPLCKRAFDAWLEDANFDEQGRQRRRLGDIRQSMAN